ncbi:MAG: hypothetical protein JNK37_10075 [Verrucomicrobiales bacterium]|nr:hypothetical protein [Verrucomicrobiales bacterium]
MNMKSLLATITAIILLTGVGVGQQMPQDNWRYDGVEFSGPDTTKALRSIAIGTGGVYVGYGNPATAIVQFQENGTFIREFGAFTYVLGIACDSAGNVFVLDRGDSKVRVFDPDGVFLREWGGPGAGDGQFSLASASWTTMIAVDSQDQVYVCDPGNARVQVFDGNGNFLRKWGDPGPLAGQFASQDPDGIAIGPNGWVYLMVNGSSPNLRIFDRQGNFIRSSAITYYSYVPDIATTPDGLLTYYANHSSPSSNFVRFLDAKLSVARSYHISTSNTRGLAHNRRGDLYAVLATSPNKVRIHQREYSNVHNSLVPHAIPQPAVLNVAQRVGVPWLDIDYKVTDADSPTVTTGALAFLDGNNTLAHVVPMTTFVEGTDANIGASQPTNVERRLTWDMAADWSVDFAQIQVEILAKDARNPLGIHWITIPAEGSAPAIEVSRGPVSEAEMLSVWYWFLATQQSGMALEAGVIRGVGGAYAGHVLASGTTTAGSGRFFQYHQLGVRPITVSELSRARAGNYGFTSLDHNSVVREPVGALQSVFIWGSNGSGQLGDGTTTSRSFPSLVATGVDQVVGGGSHSLLLSPDGTLRACGYNNFGQLGDSTGTDRTSPVQVGMASNWQSVSAGGNHSLGVRSDGTLWAWGRNSSGQLGDGTTTNRSSPVQVGTASNWQSVSAGAVYSLGVRSDGTLWAWGNNSISQLGDGTTTQRNSPVQVGTVSNWQSVSAGGSHSLGVRSDGTLWAWGYNASGQLGDGTTTQRASPVQVGTASNWQSVAAGSNHSLGVRSDGTLWAWGTNGNGQLGDGTTTQRTSPVQVGTTGNWQSVSAGGEHSLGVRSDGTLWAWGNNSNSQLGDGTTTQRSSPVQVGSDVLRASAGGSHSMAIISPQ